MTTIFAVIMLMQIVAWFRAYRAWMSEIERQSLAGLPSTASTDTERNIVAVLFLVGVTVLVCGIMLLVLYRVL